MGVELDAGPVVLRAALGPQLLFGVFSGSTVTYEGIDAAPEALETTAPNHIGFGALLGFAYQADGYSIPLELRFDWDPMVPSSTAGRFDEVPDSAQTYSAAFDFSGALMVGIDVPLAD